MKKSLALSSLLLLACSLAPSPSCGTTVKAAFPEDSPGAEPYPDCLRLPLVNLSGGVKATKFSQKEAK